MLLLSMLAGLATLGAVSPALAEPVLLDVLGPDNDNGFHFSYTHTAATGNGTYYYSGQIMTSLSGTLAADLDGQVLTVGAGEVSMSGRNGHAGGTMTLSGSLDFADSDGDQLLGTLDYEIQYEDGGTRSGAWHFFDEDFSNAAQPPNNLFADGSLRLWGNDWNNLATDAHLQGLGIDIGGKVRPIPEPHSTLLFLAGSLIVGGALARTRLST